MLDTTQEQDRRSNRRFCVSLTGKIFRADAMVAECAVLDLSPDGAAVRCLALPKGSDVILAIDGIGRLNAQCLGHERGILRLRLTGTAAQRQHIAMTLGQMLESGGACAARVRRGHRLATANFHFTRANGTKVPCDALDISLRGISVRTQVKPPIGECVTVGHSAGRVVRHHADGIGIQFQEIAGASRAAKPFVPPAPGRPVLDHLV